MFSPGSAETNIGSGGKLNGHLMASFIRNICTKNYQNLIIGFQVTVENVGSAFLGHSVVVVTVTVPETGRCRFVVRCGRLFHQTRT